MKSQNLIAAAATALILGWALPSWARPATVVGSSIGSQVYIQKQPVGNSAPTAYTLVGNQVQVGEALQGNDGQIWYNVVWANGSGWLRSDYLALGKMDTVPMGNNIGNDYADRGSLARLGGTQPGGTVNVRAYASTQATRIYSASYGEPVTILGSTLGQDGYVWNRIQVPNTGVEGWVRNDLVKVLY
jgi:Bacterial SH3 domain